MTTHVWYVAYGSILHAERFSRYLDAPSVPASYGQAWRITLNQVEDLSRQENGRAEFTSLVDQ